MKSYTTIIALLLVNTMAVAQQPAQQPITKSEAIVKVKASTASAIKKDSLAAISATEETSTVARPGQPIGGIVVKGGKNPGGSMITVTADSSGQFELTIREAGNYRFILTASTYIVSQSKSISEKGIKRTASPLYSGNAQTTDNPLYSPNAIIASPGNPIGGVIVKGGKNPGGSTLQLITTKDGEVVLNGLKPGSYRFLVTAP